MMKSSYVIRFYTVLILAVFVASTSQAQTCNPNIPLKTPGSAFTDHGDGTVTHQRTGLTWKKCLEGQSGADCTGTPTGMTWSQALTHAADHEFAGSSLWRLPNIKELASIAETACYFPAINLSIFPNDPGSFVWSSSPFAYILSYAWILDFGSGGDSPGAEDGGHYVRLVRGGQ